MATYKVNYFPKQYIRCHYKKLKPDFFTSLLILIFLSSCSNQTDSVIDESLKLKGIDNIITKESKYIAVIGDVQSYTLSSHLLHYLIETNDWLRSQQSYFNNISCVLQNGDMTENNTDDQWYFANVAFSHLGENILFIPSTGNHDYSWDKYAHIDDRYSTKINSLTCLSKIKSKSLEQFEPDHINNIIVPVKIAQDSIYVIALEFGPRKEAVTWADSIVRANPNKKYILMTHEWMTRAGQRISNGSYAAMQMPNLSHSTPQEIWERMVYPNNNILCVLCGHNGFCKYLYSTNQAGRDVCQILFNLQYQENGGDGMIQLWEFPKDENVINISVYNTIKREFHPDPETRISISL